MKSFILGYWPLKRPTGSSGCNFFSSLLITLDSHSQFYPNDVSGSSSTTWELFLSTPGKRQLTREPEVTTNFRHLFLQGPSWTGRFPLFISNSLPITFLLKGHWPWLCSSLSAPNSLSFSLLLSNSSSSLFLHFSYKRSRPQTQPCFPCQHLKPISLRSLPPTLVEAATFLFSQNTFLHVSHPFCHLLQKSVSLQQGLMLLAPHRYFYDWMNKEVARSNTLFTYM